ncbi:MAG TPA: hypothetical protein VGK21_01240, partial [Candidatus Angelobacter sp.]
LPQQLQTLLLPQNKPTLLKAGEIFSLLLFFQAIRIAILQKILRREFCNKYQSVNLHNQHAFAGFSPTLKDWKMGRAPSLRSGLNFERMYNMRSKWPSPSYKPVIPFCAAQRER